jgi:ABC-type transport system involved in multi-copper enzyme maturation permease subunit
MEASPAGPNINVSVPQWELDVNDLPEFNLTEESVGVSIAAIAPDIAILAIELIVFFALAFVAFLRYDVR